MKYIVTVIMRDDIKIFMSMIQLCRFLRQKYLEEDPKAVKGFTIIRNTKVIDKR